MNPKVQPYIFKGHVFLYRTHLETLTQIHQRFAAIASPVISSILHKTITLSLVETEQIPLSRFLRTQTVQNYYSLVNISSMPQACLFTLSPDLALNIVDSLLGDNGGSFTNAHASSPLGIAVLRQFINTILDPLKEVWQPYLTLSTHIQEMGSNLSKIEKLNKTSKYVVLAFKITLPTIIGFIHLLYPSAALFPVRHALISNAHSPTPTQKLNPEKVELTLKAILGSLHLDPQELFHLKKGDILQLDKILNQPITLAVEDIPILHCYPGLIYKRMGVILSA